MSVLPARALLFAAPKALLGGLALAVVVAVLGSGHDFGGLIPNRQLAPWPLVPAFVVVLFGTCVEGRGEWLERASARGPYPGRALRIAAGWAIGFVGLLALLLIGSGTEAGSVFEVVGVRNVLMIGGAALLASAFLPEIVALLLPAVYLIVCMVAGLSIDGTAAPWAFPFHPVHDATASALAWALAIGGSAVAVLRGTRSTS